MANYALEGPTWTTRTITWSFADPSDPNSSQFSGAIGAAYQSVVQAAVGRWDDVIDLTFVQVPDTTPGVDIRIGWASFATSQVGETDYSYSLGAPETFTPGVSVRLEDPASLPLSAGPAATYQGTSTTLYQVALHELGHALGLDHSTDPTAIMYPSVGSGNPDLGTSDLLGIHTLYAPPAFAMTDAASGVSNHPDGTVYSGPVSYLQQQLLYTGSDAVAISASQPNVFIHGGPSSDAIAVSSGQNVIDGGQGSNFLIGGTGTDTFFLDGRGGQVTWDTLVNFHAGDQATVWGFDPANSNWTWAGVDGAAGYTGLTLRADLGGVASSITFAGLSTTDTTRFAISTGTVSDGTPYLLISDVG